jgi:hypothetical protein
MGFILFLLKLVLMFFEAVVYIFDWLEVFFREEVNVTEVYFYFKENLIDKKAGKTL